jgi:hypothetical protein
MPRPKRVAAHGESMLLGFALISALSVAPSDTVPVIAATDTIAALTSLAGVTERPIGISAPSFVDDTTPSRRRKAVEISDSYALRLKIHYLASYATIPIFAAQAIVGQQLYNQELVGQPSRSLITTHDAIAVALGGLFAVNTVTGAWNWWETRDQKEGRTWRTIHAALMLVADGGFAATAALGSGAKYSRGTLAGRDLHKNMAIGSASVALVSYIMMWKPFRRD